MNEGMHFLNQVQDAYRDKDAAKSLADFFSKAQIYNNDPEFMSFMNESILCRNGMEQLSVIQSLLDQDLIADSMEINGWDLGFMEILCGIYDQIMFSEKNKSLGIQIFCNNTPQHQFDFTETNRYHRCKNIRPGSYLIKLSTGMVVWHKELQEKHVIWNKEQHQKELKLAAHTKPDNIEPVLEEIVMRKIKICVFAGIDAGIMEIRLL